MSNLIITPVNAVTTHSSTTASDDANTTVELSENFYINNSHNKRKNNVKIQVKLTGEGVYLRRETEENDHINEQLIRLEDIIGSRCGPRLNKRTRGGLSSCRRDQTDEDPSPASRAADTKDTSAYLYIYAYLRKEEPLRRTETVRILRFCTYAHYEANYQTAARWHAGIKRNKRQMETYADAQSSDDDEKQLLILLNPKSGKGRGRVMFQKQVAPVLKAAEIAYDLQVTTHMNFAREFVRKRADLAQRYKGIIVASGDGLFYEVLNGLMERPDWLQVSRALPLGIIPCGSGNGLAKSIAYCYNEPYEPKPILNATLTCVSGSSALLDVVRVELGEKRQEMYSFLSVGWGILADVDIESERLRSIGSPRFTLWSIHRLIKLRTYKGRISWLPWRKEHVAAQPGFTSRQATNEGKDEGEEKRQTQQQNAARRASNNSQEFYDLPAHESTAYADPNDDDEFADALSLDRTSFRPHINSWTSATSKMTAYYSAAGQSIRSRRSLAASIMSNKIEAANSALEQNEAQQNVPPPKSTLPPLGIPLPEGAWRSEEGEFVLVQTAYTTHLAADVLFAPDSQLNDGIIYMLIVRAGVGRAQLLHFLLNLSSGTHLPETPNEHIEMLRVSAFRIEPFGKEGILTVDGERVTYGHIQGEMLPGLIRLMVPNSSKH